MKTSRFTKSGVAAQASNTHEQCVNPFGGSGSEGWPASCVRPPPHQPPEQDAGCWHPAACILLPAKAPSGAGCRTLASCILASCSYRYYHDYHYYHYYHCYHYYYYYHYHYYHDYRYYYYDDDDDDDYHYYYDYYYYYGDDDGDDYYYY